MKYEDLEFRWSDPNNSYELVKWNKDKEFCYVVAFFDERKDGCEIRFIGDRAFKYENEEVMWEMLKYGQKIVDAKINFLNSVN